MDYQLKLQGDKDHLQENIAGTGDVTLSFDVGHSSIGWAVLKSTQRHPEILGTGVVTFPADDCLASQRRAYRRQRRHVRSTRLRISRMEKLLVHLGIFSQEQLQKKHGQGTGHPAPWLLAARVLASGGKSEYLLTWDELWDVLRWYAHNRGYDGNSLWAGDAEDIFIADDVDSEIEKVETAKKLMEEYSTKTMAETVTAIMYQPFGGKKALDIGKEEPLPFFTKASRYKEKNAAFPRGIVKGEVLKLLKAHQGRLAELTNALINFLLYDAKNEELLKKSGLKLPKRFVGGLLFGQLIPRFDNRIISLCPVSSKKVPSKSSKEFLLFRWLIQLANVRVEHRTLSKDERGLIHQKMVEKGYFTISEFKKVVREITQTSNDNLDAMLLHPEADKALLLDPVKKLIASQEVQLLWKHLPEQVRKRAAGKWFKGKKLTLNQILDWSEEFECNRELLLAEVKSTVKVSSKKGGKKRHPDFSLDRPLGIQKLKGRAPYHRSILKKAAEEILAGFDPRKKTIYDDPENGEEKESNGVLVPAYTVKAVATSFPAFETWKARWERRSGNQGKSLQKAQQEYEEAKAQSFHDAQTNNHLVRHRLLILCRLVRDIINDPSLLNGDSTRVKAAVIEVNREMKEHSGKTAKQIAQDLGLRLSSFKSAVEKLQKAGIRNPSVSLIRKARIAEDLKWQCPYTGRTFDPVCLLDINSWDKDHIIPYSQRASDSLDSLVITSRTINQFKSNRTALEFIEWINQPENFKLRDELGVRTPAQYRDFVASLDTRKGHADDVRRKRRRQQLLLTPKWEERTGNFLPRDLTVTSHLVRLGALVLHQCLPHLQSHNIASIPGSVTATLRTGWKLLGTLQSVSSNVLDAQNEIKTKTEIREITHLHHALDAMVLGLTHHYFPKNGRLWEAMVRRAGQRTEEDKKLLLATGLYHIKADVNLKDIVFERKIPECLEKQIREKLAEKRVIQHLPSDMSGLKVEENTRGVESVSEDGKTVYLRQVTRDASSGGLNLKRTTESTSKLVGLRPGKLRAQSGVRVITANYGVAILDEIPCRDDGSKGQIEDQFIIIPFANVRNKIQAIKELNGGRLARVLRIGSIIKVSGGRSHQGYWKIFSVKNNADGVALCLGEVDAIKHRNDKQNVRLRQLIKDGLEMVKQSLSGNELNHSL